MIHDIALMINYKKYDQQVRYMYVNLMHYKQRNYTVYTV
jgi:hypothetical protein